jgi:hypothetical protein
MCGYDLRLSRNKVTVRERAVEIMKIFISFNLIYYSLTLIYFIISRWADKKISKGGYISLKRKTPGTLFIFGFMAEMVDAADLKSVS